MSNPLAIAAVTATLRNLLVQGITPEIPDATVTTTPPDKARDSNSGNQINIFLYQTEPNPAWRSMDPPRQARPGEVGQPSLSLNLYYLVTAYGRNDDDVTGHHLLGRAMSVLHDHPVLSPDHIRIALPDNDLHEQVERVRITPQPLSLDEMSKLWNTFQTQYRISAAYQVSLVLIDSTRPVPSPLPVLRRGEEDRGPVASAAAPPSLTEARPPTPQPSARLGEDLTIHGLHLDGEGLTARFASFRLPAPIEVDPLAERTPTALTVHLPDPAEEPAALAGWAPGFYTLALVVRRADLPTWTTNEVSFALAPTITVAPDTAPPGDVNLTLTCRPRMRDAQRALLLFGDRQIAPQTVTTPEDATQPTTLTFLVPEVAAGSYVVRLRVDGVDSLPFVRTGTPPRLEFDPNQKVTIG
ncbi:MAG: DUF4255 domain-containing protein [Anaerolineae bacterium]|jgi:hypothetical protein